ncbi:MAG: tyrosine-type recombinase/integrase [Terriglobales bacterium]
MQARPQPRGPQGACALGWERGAASGWGQGPPTRPARSQQGGQPDARIGGARGAAALGPAPTLPVLVAAPGGHGVNKGKALKSPRMWFDPAHEKARVHDFTWRCLRHTQASRLVMAGVGLRGVQELMGHKTIAMTCRYAHLAPSHQLAAVRRLDGWGEKGSENGKPTGTRAKGPRRAGVADTAQVLVQ